MKEPWGFAENISQFIIPDGSGDPVQSWKHNGTEEPTPALSRSTGDEGAGRRAPERRDEQVGDDTAAAGALAMRAPCRPSPSLVGSSIKPQRDSRVDSCGAPRRQQSRYQGHHREQPRHGHVSPRVRGLHAE